MPNMQELVSKIDETVKKDGPLVGLTYLAAAATAIDRVEHNFELDEVDKIQLRELTKQIDSITNKWFSTINLIDKKVYKNNLN